MRKNVLRTAIVLISAAVMVYAAHRIYQMSEDAIIWPVVDFAALESINSDCVAWIRIDGTEIDYPVVQGHDNSFYLKHLFDGEWNSTGCIFLDSRVEPDLSDQHSVLYALSMLAHIVVSAKCKSTCTEAGTVQ